MLLDPFNIVPVHILMFDFGRHLMALTNAALAKATISILDITRDKVLSLSHIWLNDLLNLLILAIK